MSTNNYNFDLPDSGEATLAQEDTPGSTEYDLEDVGRVEEVSGIGGVGEAGEVGEVSELVGEQRKGSPHLDKVPEQVSTLEHNTSDPPSNSVSDLTATASENIEEGNLASDIMANPSRANLDSPHVSRLENQDELAGKKTTSEVTKEDRSSNSTINETATVTYEPMLASIEHEDTDVERGGIMPRIRDSVTDKTNREDFDDGESDDEEFDDDEYYGESRDFDHDQLDDADPDDDEDYGSSYGLSAGRIQPGGLFLGGRYEGPRGRDTTPVGIGGHRQYFYNGRYTLRGGASRSRSRLSSDRCTSCGHGRNIGSQRPRRRSARGHSRTLEETTSVDEFGRERRISDELARERKNEEPHHRNNVPVPSYQTSMVALKAKAKNPLEVQTFTVHKSFLCHYSRAFNAALTGDTQEAATQTLELDTEPSVVGLLVHWIYTQKVQGSEIELTTENLLLFWLLAERFQLPPRLQNDIMHAYINADRRRPRLCFSLLEHIWQNTTKNSPLRCILVEEFACFMDRRTTEDEKALIPKSMMADMMEVFMRVRDSGDSGRERWNRHVIEPSLDFFVMERP